jgi:uncharacterized protein (DUF4415 family)
MKRLFALFLFAKQQVKNGKNMNKPTKTNWEAFDALTDEQIDTSDTPPLTDDFFANAKWRMSRSKNKVKVTVEIEPEVLAWFQAQGENYEQALTAALRLYAQAHQE